MEIFGESDKTGECPFYVSFFQKEEDAVKELKTQLKLAMVEFGWDVYLSKDKVLLDDKVVYCIEKFKLK